MGSRRARPELSTFSQATTLRRVLVLRYRRVGVRRPVSLRDQAGVPIPLSPNSNDDIIYTVYNLIGKCFS